MIKEYHVSENLFDKSTATLNERVTTSGTTSYTGAFASDYISIGENVNCTVTGLITSIVTVIYFYDSSNTNIGYTSADSASSYSFTTPTGTAKLRFTGDMNYINSASVIINTWNTKSYCKATTGSKTYSNFPIVVRSREQSIPSWSMKGNEQHTGTPSPSSSIEINGTGERTANLLDITQANAKFYTDYPASIYDNFTVQNGVITFEDSQAAMLYYLVPVDENTTYYYKISTSDTTTVRIRNYSDIVTSRTNNFIENSFNSQIRGNFTRSYTTPTNTKYVAIEFYHDPSEAEKSAFNIMVSETETNYEPYGYKIPISANGAALTSVYLTEQLMKIGDTVDSLVSAGTVTYNIKKLVLTGEENWKKSSTYDGSFYAAILSNSTSPYQNNILICTHAVHVNPINSTTYTYGKCGTDRSQAQVNSNLNLFIGQAGWSVSDFQAYLAHEYTNGTPVTVWYVLATPTTEQVTVPTIPTISSPTTIDVNTSVKPSEMSLTYDGYKICKEQKYQNNAWT